MDKEEMQEHQVDDFDTYSDEEENLKNYWVLLMIVASNVFYAILSPFITIYLILLLEINVCFIYFIPSIISLVVIGYVLLGLRKGSWNRGADVNWILFGSALALIIQIGMIAWLIAFPPAY